MGANNPLVSPFSDPDLWTKLEQDSRTKEFLKDPDFKQKITNLQKNPKMLQ